MTLKTDQGNYACGYDRSLRELQAERNLETYGQFIKPYLKANLSILDCGCGQGTMTLDFADQISPGKVVGIDISEKILQAAKENASSKNVSNVSFQQANVLDLPFPDNTFDIVYAQTLLAHLPEPMRAIHEMKRVVKAGGIIAAKECYLSSWFLYPENKFLNEFMVFRMKPVLQNGGDLDIGVKLGELFYNAGLGEISFEMHCLNRNVPTFAKIFADDAIESTHSKAMLASGEVNQERLLRYREEWLKFSKIPWARNGMLYGEIISKKIS